MSRAGLWEVLKCVTSEVLFQLVLCRGQCQTKCSSGAHGLCIVAWWGVWGGGGMGRVMLFVCLAVVMQQLIE